VIFIFMCLYYTKARKMEDNKKTIEEIKALTEDILEYQSVDVEKGYMRIGKRMQKKQGRRIYMQTISRIAVILLLPLLISSIVFSYLYMDQKKQLAQVTYNQVSSAPGTVTRLVLPDQSVVWLNSGSSLSYPSVFSGKERDVKLSGEGYFEVQSDREHPFYVSTDGGVKVMAYGTKFNINAYEDESCIEAVLAKGKIDVISRNKTVSLEPEKQALFDKETGKFTVSSVNLEEKIGWKDGRLVFRNTPLDVVLKKLSKRYNVDIVLHKTSNKEYKYRAAFTTETVEQILNYLKLTAPIEWTVKGLEQNNDATFARGRIDVYQK
jgi:transmembrane sensor